MNIYIYKLIIINQRAFKSRIYFEITYVFWSKVFKKSYILSILLLLIKSTIDVNILDKK